MKVLSKFQAPLRYKELSAGVAQQQQRQRSCIVHLNTGPRQEFRAQVLESLGTRSNFQIIKKKNILVTEKPSSLRAVSASQDGSSTPKFLTIVGLRKVFVKGLSVGLVPHAGLYPTSGVCFTWTEFADVL